MKGSPFLLIPWHGDFLHPLLERILADCEGDVSRALIIVPHSRPEKYLHHLLEAHPGLKRPLILPEMLPIGPLFSLLRQHMCQIPAWEAGTLDRVGLLLACVREEISAVPAISPLFARDASGLEDAFAFVRDARHFFPWGLRLASLFEECFVQARTPRNFEYMEGEVAPFAASLLERLSGIYERYVRALQGKNWTTPGFDAASVVKALEDGTRLPAHLFQDKRIYLAGFHALTRTEDTLFRHLWEDYGATVLVHADPALAQGVAPHWSCEAFAHWAGSWQTRFELLDAPAEASGAAAQQKHAGLPLLAQITETPPAPDIRYIEGFDLHSQLAALHQTLLPATAEARENAAPSDALPAGRAPRGEIGGKAGSPGAAPSGGPGEPAAPRPHSAPTVVVLPDSGLLMPVLHHLPRVDSNVSMGYPLTRSPLFRLVDTLFRLQERRRDAAYYWRDLVELVRHPYLKMLTPEAGPDHAPDGQSHEDARHGDAFRREDHRDIRKELHRFEQFARTANQKYVDPRLLLKTLRDNALVDGSLSPEADALLADLFTAALDNFTIPRTPRAMGRALEGLCALLLTHGAHLWERFPIDAECLYRLLQSLIPELMHTSLADEVFPPHALIDMVRQLMHTQRVPFEASPLVGLQVMGVLETRLLTFDRVVIMDATDDALPGIPAGDPLLPESLRPILELPSRRTREQVAAYHFFRLIKSAREVTLLWQEGSEAGGIQERACKKSRFIEELLWEEEKRQGRLLAAQGSDGPLTVLRSSIAPVNKHPFVLEVTPTIRALVEGRMARPLSPSFLNAYILCPVKWYYEHIARLRTTDEVPEGDDPLAVGNLFHQTLQRFYTPFVGRPFPQAGQTLADATRDLVAAFHEELGATLLKTSLPADAYAMLVSAGGLRLARYLEQQPPTLILALEKNLETSFACQGREYALHGTVDRIDRRDDGFVVLDYKTGSIPAMRKTLWEESPLWHALASWTPNRENAALLTLSTRMPSIQLPFYVHLLARELARDASPFASQRETPAFLDAAFIDLGSAGQEMPLFSSEHREKTAAAAIGEQIPTLIDFLIRHMSQAPAFFPHTGEHCRWCSVQKLCMILSDNKAPQL